MIGLIGMVFGFSAAYCVWRSRQMRLGQAWSSDAYLGWFMGFILGVGCILVAAFHL